ncbi:glyoxalase/bleomycin resistance protein/dioxygenase superfamily protein 14 [Hyphomonas adhaerens MHS-3]|uniref:Bleomycin resistance protein n=1 Tax=Hyphomonas adhaerens MHS-3 TaxID=1280949 RepID=A0A069E324_9PROT|nr:VOC family protein [Hyphomonas adhaerens]KCZ84545.1 glyoxalase/bleomycin resistance protein/dioxygenase superfamily protein 14 [Hyphomonas adhaerens MHS-3]
MAAALVPELYVSDLARSLDFYCGALGFSVVYQRPEERFAYLERAGAELMLEEPVGRTWLAGPLEAPYGRGVNFQIEVEDAAALRDAALAAGAPLVLDLEEKTYLRDDEPIRVRQCVVQDPDGYLLRFSELL